MRAIAIIERKIVALQKESARHLEYILREKTEDATRIGAECLRDVTRDLRLLRQLQTLILEEPDTGGDE